MNVSHDWLRAWVPHGLSAEQLGRLLSEHVATLDGLEPLRRDLAPFVVGQVVASERIPDTRLSFNKVDDGSGTLLDVVCGAPNVDVGAKYPFARVGTVIPGKGGITIERRKIRGFTSAGMLCSAMELGLGDDHEGILALDTAAAPGTPLLSVLPAGDVRLDVDVLANRPDLLSHRGIAREVAALTGVALRLPGELSDVPAIPAAATGETEATARGVTVRIEDPEGCRRLCAAVIRGCTVGPSPAWLAERLAAVGARSISNVVDATNYCLFGLGQPMHAFDLGRLGPVLVARRARDGERLVTIDGDDRTLDGEVLVIADATRAAAIAGVMGGRETEVTSDTVDVLLEVAYFEPRRVRRSRLRAGVSTDASYRFERGVDREATRELLAFGAGLVAALAGGRVEAVLDVGSAPGALPPVRLRASRLARLLGADIPDAEVERLLGAIGFGVTADGDRTWTVAPPPWRHDVLREADLAEEVARLVGYDALPAGLGAFRPGTVPDDPTWVVGARVREALVAAGLLEAKPLPFVAGSDGTHVRVANPLADDEPHLRTSVLETLARRAEHNLARMHGDVRLFEVGSVFAPAGHGAEQAPAPGLPVERLRVGLLVMGARRPPHFTEKSPPAFDLWDAKALAEVVAAAGFPGGDVAVVPAGDGDSLWRIDVDGVTRGEVRQVPLDLPPWASPAFGVELDLGQIGSAAIAAEGVNAWDRGGSESERRPAGRPVTYRPLPTTPAATFDLALVVADDVTAGEVAEVLRSAAGDVLERLQVFDEFRGGELPVGTRSLAWRVTLRDPQRTFSQKEIEGRKQKLLRALEDSLGVRQRTA